MRKLNIQVNANSLEVSIIFSCASNKSILFLLRTKLLKFTRKFYPIKASKIIVLCEV